MRIIPVIDLMNGLVVRGVAGRRAEYRPIVSQLTKSAAPLDVARAFREHFGLKELYLADLDAIGGKPPALATYSELLGEGFSLWVDAGPKWKPLHSLGIQKVVLGLESLAGPVELAQALSEVGSENLIFSLDLQDGEPLGHKVVWGIDVGAIATQAVGLGVKHILILDLAGVGTNQGSKTGGWCGQLRREFPSLIISTGGGVRGIDDLVLLEWLGVDNALVASALHDGRLPNGV